MKTTQNSLKTNNGITLIILVITIIILLIIVGIMVVATTVILTDSTKEKNTGVIKIGEKAEEDTTMNGEKGEYNNPTIPRGFKAVDTETAKWNDSNGWQNGLVIEDATNDPVTQGSQFVWIPVQNYEDFHLIEGYMDGEIDDLLDSDEHKDPSREAGSNIDGTEPGIPN